MSNRQLSLFDIAVSKADQKQEILSEVEFDYGVGKAKTEKTFTPQVDPKGIVKKIEIQYGLIDQYLIDCVGGIEYEKEFNNDFDAINFVKEVFTREYMVNKRNYYKDNVEESFADWIAGLPSSFNVDFTNEEIFRLTREWGCITEDSDEDQCDEFINSWWLFISKRFFMLIKELEKEAPLTAGVCGILSKCVVSDKIVKLPEGKLDRSLYVEVKNKLELIGGKWKGGKVQGFVFDEDPSEILEQIASGENRNLKKEFQFFGTPDVLADRLVKLAKIGENHSVLEPSAGQGAIVKAILRSHPEHIVYGYELMPLNQTFLKKIEGFVLDGFDFLTECTSTFSRIIANPPFAKNQDIDHIRKMYSLLNDEGRLVSISSNHWKHSSNKKETEFREWLEALGADVIDVDSGAFKESGTGIATSIIVIDKK